MSMDEYLRADCPPRIQKQLMELASRNTRRVLAWIDAPINDPSVTTTTAGPISVSTTSARYPRRYQRVIVRHAMDVSCDELHRVLLPSGDLNLEAQLVFCSPSDDVKDVTECCHWPTGNVGEFVTGVDVRVKKATWASKSSSLPSGSHRFLQHANHVWDRPGPPVHVSSLTAVAEYHVTSAQRVATDALAPTVLGLAMTAGDDGGVVLAIVAVVTDKHASLFETLAKATMSKILERVQSLRFASYSSTVSSLLPGAIARGTFGTKPKPKFLDRVLGRNAPPRLDHSASLLLSPRGHAVDAIRSGTSVCYLCPTKTKPYRHCVLCKQLLCKKCREKVHGKRVCRPCMYKGQSVAPRDSGSDVRSSESSSSASQRAASSATTRSSHRGGDDVPWEVSMTMTTASNDSLPYDLNDEGDCYRDTEVFASSAAMYRDTEVTRSVHRLGHLEADFNAVCAAMCVELDCKYALVVIGDVVSGAHYPATANGVPHALKLVPTTKFVGRHAYHLHHIKELAFVLQKNLFAGHQRIGHVLLADDKMHRRGDLTQTTATLQAYEDTLVEINQSTIL
ncbi:hypothetical protein SDRG_00628 [Saprolegnia diclina VS20]|uniref:Uncharacterized protein n=1 Tax=Saprolegnia diclina (strain VS20) TaxID=1156394 RepID=T0R5S2_SAPDV|nr:hypothetical protein SDRG_00628 [Saprolegnia diclina VS20]EQC41765.1 hypothetical protein SDRG_00628 [Saprolegnia diclina VS20]|eukprot:XP_008604334.1 hypothetical protein SDRG_00628 [Saprolegnia diclina VS20]